jgi:ribulose 1,5-bisphosphate synthetase/thiazole synthase
VSVAGASQLSDRSRVRGWQAAYAHILRRNSGASLGKGLKENRVSMGGGIESGGRLVSKLVRRDILTWAARAFEEVR